MHKKEVIALFPQFNHHYKFLKKLTQAQGTWTVLMDIVFWLLQFPVGNWKTSHLVLKFTTNILHFRTNILHFRTNILNFRTNILHILCRFGKGRFVSYLLITEAFENCNKRLPNYSDGLKDNFKQLIEGVICDIQNYACQGAINKRRFKQGTLLTHWQCTRQPEVNQALFVLVWNHERETTSTAVLVTARSTSCWCPGCQKHRLAQPQNRNLTEGRLLGFAYSTCMILA